jgi:hypothetical protein
MEIASMLQQGEGGELGIGRVLLERVGIRGEDVQQVGAREISAGAGT